MRALLVALGVLMAGTPAGAADHLGVILDWFVNPDHAPVLVAKAIGAYDAEGLDVTLIPPADPAMGPKLVAAGQGDLALTGEPEFLEQVAAGLTLVRIGVLIDKPLSTLVVLQSSGIRQLRDLRGKRIGCGSGDVERAMIGTMLQGAGLSLDDVQVVQIGEQLSVALLSHQVDAVSVFRNFEPIELRLHGAATVGFDYEANGVPSFDEMIIVARAADAADSRLARFVRATTRGLAYLREHPAESWELVRKAYPDLDDPLNRAAWTATLPSFAVSAAELDRGRYDVFERYLYSHGLISAITPVSAYTVGLP